MKHTIFILSLLVFLACNNTTEAKKDILETTEKTATTLKDGPYVEKDENGNTLIAGEILNGIRVGIWTSYYPNGRLRSEIEYSTGSQNGIYQVFWQNGEKRINGFYKYGKPANDWVFYDSTGVIVTKKTFE
jgi:antitoxin component YwqK of YwqJK toxin-antitoxin module